jgi:hypothetical protein
MSFVTASDEKIINGISLEAYQAPMGEVLGAVVDQTFYDNPTNQLLRMKERSAVTPHEAEQVVDPFTGEVLGESKAITPDMLDAETARSKIAEAGIKYQVPDAGISAPLLDLIIRDKREAMRREQIMARAPGGVVNGSLQFAAALGASILDPLNVASAFIPVVGEARFAKMMAGAGTGAFARAGARAKVGAIEGAVGQAMIEPLMAMSASDDQIDYTAADTLRNIAFGAFMGSTIRAGGGAIKDKFFSSPSAKPVVESDLKPTAAADIVSRMNPETHQAAMKGAIAQAASGRMVDVDAVAKLDPAAAPGVAAADASPIGFVTSKGSTYEWDGASTVRNKADHSAQGHDVSDVGVKPRSEQTVFVSEEDAQRIGMHNSLNSEAKPKVVFREDGIQLMSWNSKENRWGLDGALIPYTKQPEVGKAPMEFWGLKDTPELNGKTAKSNHPGNAITELRANDPLRGVDDAQPKPRDLSSVRAAAERASLPESSRTADMKAAAEADAQLKEAPPDYDLEAAQKELTDVMNDLKATAEQLGVEPGLKAFDDQVARAAQYEKALKAAAVCGMRG